MKNRRGSKQRSSGHNRSLDKVPSAYSIICIHNVSSLGAKVAVFAAKGCNKFTEDCDGFTDILP